MLHQLHNSHPGIAQTKASTYNHVWWPDLDQNIEHVVKGCQNCQLQQTTPVAATVHPLIWPQVPWYRLHIDYCGLFLGYMWLAVVDATTRMGGNYSGKRSQLSTDYTGSEYHFCEVWLANPNLVRQWLSLLRSSVDCESKRIHQIFSALFHPRSNGEVECTNACASL